jgi:hypothetical protein
MSEETTNGTEQTKEGDASANGKEKVSFLTTLRKEWEAAGSKDPNDNDKKRLVGNFKAASDKVQELESQLAKAQAEEEAAILSLAKAFGARSLKISGTVYDFASRGQKVFLKKKSSSNVVEL